MTTVESILQLRAELENMKECTRKELAAYNALANFCFDTIEPDEYELIYRFEHNSMLFSIIGDYMYQLIGKLDELIAATKEEETK